VTYSVKEIYYTLQGEGIRTGRPAVFCRFSGCNLWSGLERDRSTAICRFCDTDFVGTNGPGGGKFKTAQRLAQAVVRQWPGTQERYVVCTGGEPLLQLDGELVAAFHERDFEVAVETNGTLRVPAGVDWICVSPKAGTSLIQDSGQELKLVFPQSGAMPERFEDLGFEHFLLQPMDGVNRRENTAAALRYCLDHPRWRLSLQTHKILAIP